MRHHGARALRSVLAAALLGAVGVGLAPPSGAMPIGNYNVAINGRYDFHTWVWMISACDPDCLQIGARPQPVARAYPWRSVAQLSGGTYTMTVDDPFGLRCDNVYYGPVNPTHDVYSWDATTLTGAMQSSFDVGCDGAPGGSFTYPIALSRM